MELLGFRVHKTMGNACSQSPRTAPEWSVEALTSAVDAMPVAVEAAKTVALLPASPLPKPPDEAISAQMFSWTFDIFSVPYDLLPRVAFTALTSHPELPASSDEAKTKLWRFVGVLAGCYHERPFHSFRHAVDVLLATSALIRQVRLDRPDCFGEEREILTGALLIAALVHDVNHPGCMNGLLVGLKHPLAASDTTAVLERHHAELALALLDRPELDFLAELGAEARGRIVSFVRDMVLATDVTTTMKLAKEISTIVETGESPVPLQIAKLIVKGADISNPTRALPVYQQWTDGVLQEFFVQGDLEKQRGLPVSMNCDRETVSRAKCQVGFISFLVGPLFKSLHSLAPSLKPMVESLESNLQFFKDEAAKASA